MGKSLFFVGSLFLAASIGASTSYGIEPWQNKNLGLCREKLTRILLNGHQTILTEKAINSAHWLAVPYSGGASGRVKLGYTLPLEEPGSTLDLLAEGKTISAFLKTDSHIFSWILREDCSLESHDRKALKQLPPMAHSDSFNDSDLRALMKQNSAGVIYSWSPHMPLSVSALKHIEEVCKTHRIALTVLLDPSADTAGVAKTVRLTASKSTPIKNSFLRKNHSEILARNGSYLHYPNLILYKDGKVLRGNLFGAKSPALYTKFIQNHLNQL